MKNNLFPVIPKEAITQEWPKASEETLFQNQKEIF